MEKLTGIDLLKSAKDIEKEIGIIEMQIRSQSAAMEGLTSMRISDMPRSRPMPAGLDKVYAAKDELERKQRETVACLYEQLREAEELLQTERNPDMRIVMRMIFIEGKRARDVKGLLHMCQSSLDRVIRRIKEKYS